ncbi:MAG: insulinase family protein [Planctomycetes bacterium]|nr:insulinase family protein [Planctomycetota bacterium]
MTPAGKWSDFHIYDLDSKIKLFVQPTGRFKNVALRLFVRAHLGEDPSATAVLPHVLSRGTRKRPTMAKITEHLDGMYGAAADAEAVKIGENHVLSFRVDCVADRHLPGRSGNVKAAMEFLMEMATDPARSGKSLREDYVAQEVHNQQRALEDMMSDRAEWASQRCLEAMCKGEAYATHEMGTLAGLKKVTASSLAARHKLLFETHPMELYVAGRVEPDEIAALANRIFRIRGRSTVCGIPETVVDVPVGEPRRVTETMDVEQGKLVIGMRTRVTYRDPDSTALSFFNGIFGAFAHSRLFVNVRERHGLAYSAGSSLEKTKGLMMIHAGIDVAKFEKCLEVILAELESIRAGRISDGEIEATRRAMMERARAVLDSPSRAIAGLYERRLSGKVLTVDEALGEIAAVGKEAVVEVARKAKIDTIYWLTSK